VMYGSGAKQRISLRRVAIWRTVLRRKLHWLYSGRRLAVQHAVHGQHLRDVRRLVSECSLVCPRSDSTDKGTVTVKRFYSSTVQVAVSLTGGKANSSYMVKWPRQLECWSRIVSSRRRPPMGPARWHTSGARGTKEACCR